MDNVACLQEAVKMEIFGVHQYLAHHYNLDAIGYKKLAEVSKRVAIEEMKHVARISERIREMGFAPVSELSEPVTLEGSPLELFEQAVKIESNTLGNYATFEKVCREYSDLVSATLLQELSKEEQAHLEEFLQIRNFILALGDVYLAVQA